MVLFPEGGFLRKRKAVSQRYAQKNNLPLLDKVSLPRVGALQAIMNTVGPNSVVKNNNSSVSEGNLFLASVLVLRGGQVMGPGWHKIPEINSFV